MRLPYFLRMQCSITLGYKILCDNSRRIAFAVVLDLKLTFSCLPLVWGSGCRRSISCSSGPLGQLVGCSDRRLRLLLLVGLLDQLNVQAE